MAMNMGARVHGAQRKREAGYFVQSLHKKKYIELGDMDNTTRIYRYCGSRFAARSLRIPSEEKNRTCFYDE